MSDHPGSAGVNLCQLNLRCLNAPTAATVTFGSTTCWWTPICLAALRATRIIRVDTEAKHLLVDGQGAGPRNWKTP